MKGYKFSDDSLDSMNNFEAIHECEDQRDAERLRKRAAFAAESKSLTNALHLSAMPEDIDLVLDDGNGSKSAQRDWTIQQTLLKYIQSDWLKENTDSSENEMLIPAQSAPKFSCPDINHAQLKQWKKEIKAQETMASQQRRNALNPAAQATTSLVDNTECTAHGMYPSDTTESPLPTSTPKDTNPDSVSIDELIKNIGLKYKFNEGQWVAYHIITRYFVKKFLSSTTENNTCLPLRMLLTGPGGTGKTHVVKAVQELLSHCGLAHKICFLAPTGSAAAIINGMTIHKGLGIQIKSNNKGKGNRHSGDNSEDLTVLISVKNQTVLRDEWKDVEMVVLDEASLLCEELLCEADHSFRFAKETPHEWFGGISITFSGDFFQYPPVGGSPLYTPISAYSGQSDKEILKRLGRLAWKTVDTVVTLTEQKRMEGDKEYGDAVNRLRTRTCNYDDVDLFNSRIVKSANNSNGTDMGLKDNNTAAAIVNTNLLRETLNAHKAHAICSGKHKELLVTCAALDKLTSGVMSKFQHEALLRLNLTSSANKNMLPSSIPLYVGMPVILRLRNICTELGITNGAQGIVHKISTKTCSYGYIYATCVLVEFPGSKIHLTGLPPVFFPIEPISMTFTVLLPDTNGAVQKVQFTRHQLPLQPSFAVTGQSAQGKTLPKVLANLHEGGFSAYVAASCAQTRDGLCISEAVTLEQLNKQIPYDLKQEIHCLEALEHNTYIRYNFKSGDLIPIPDPESERSANSSNVKVAFQTSAHKTPLKKKADQELPGHIAKKPKLQATPPSTAKHKSEILFSSEYAKKPKSQNTTNESQSDIMHISTNKHKEDLQDIPWMSKKGQHAHCSKYHNCPYFSGCSWNSTDWSCAYDSAFMTLFNSYHVSNELWRNAWSHCSQTTLMLAKSFDVLLSSEGKNLLLNIFRDKLRDHLSALSPVQFPRHGAVGAPAQLIFDYLLPVTTRHLSLIKYCPNDCYHEVVPTPYHCSLPTTLSQALWNRPIDNSDWDMNAKTASISLWIEQYLRCKLDDYVTNTIPSSTYHHGCNLQILHKVALVDASKMFTLEVLPETMPTPLPQVDLRLPGLHSQLHYRLTGIIYSGSYHFTAKFITSDNRLWCHDGQTNNGHPYLDTDWDPISHNPNLVVKFGNCSAHIYIFCLAT